MKNKDKEKLKNKKENENAATRAKAEKKRARKSTVITFLFNIIGSMIVILIGLLWQNAYDVMAWSNALLLAFIMIFFVGWIMFIHNKNIISIFTHSFKTFGLMLIGKRPAKSYYEVKVGIEENPIPNKYIIISFVWSGILLVATIILTILAL